MIIIVIDMDEKGLQSDGLCSMVWRRGKEVGEQRGGKFAPDPWWRRMWLRVGKGRR